MLKLENNLNGLLQYVDKWKDGVIKNHEAMQIIMMLLAKIVVDSDLPEKIKEQWRPFLK